MATVEEVTIDVRSDTSNLKKGFDKADKRINKTGKLLRRLGVALAGVFAVRTIARWASDTARWANELDKVAREMGITVRGAQQLNFLAEATGISIANIRDGAFEIKKRFGEIGENERFRNTMKSLNISKERAEGLNNAQLMFLTLERISKLPIDKQEIALDQAFGGGAAKEFNQLVKDRKFFLDVLERTGGLVQIEGGVEGIKRFRVESALLKSNFKAISANILTRLIPHVARLAEWMNRNSDFLAEMIVRITEFGIKGVQRAVEFMKELWTWSDKVSEAYLTDEDLQRYGKWAETFGQILDTIVAIVDTVRDLVVLIKNPSDTINSLFVGAADSLRRALGFKTGARGNEFDTRQGSLAPGRFPGAAPAPPPQFFNSGQGPLRQSPAAPMITQNILLQGMTGEQAASKIRREQQQALRDLRTD